MYKKKCYFVFRKRKKVWFGCWSIFLHLWRFKRTWPGMSNRANFDAMLTLSIVKRAFCLNGTILSFFREACFLLRHRLHTALLLVFLLLRRYWVFEQSCTRRRLVQIFSCLESYYLCTIKFSVCLWCWYLLFSGKNPSFQIEEACILYSDSITHTLHLLIALHMDLAVWDSAGCVCYDYNVWCHLRFQSLFLRLRLVVSLELDNPSHPPLGVSPVCVFLSHFVITSRDRIAHGRSRKDR